ncbi:MAG TPA: HAD-IA family hydrolase [Alphaproteobacteria bacterium]|nr:HAD-IA family hydrolase [Alphaproteobacteria bacterium]
MTPPRYAAILFDLLTALLDSWTLWDAVAGSAEDGRRWRAAYLRRTYQAGAYRPYDTLVAEAARETGQPPDLAKRLAARYGELRPWPEAPQVLRRLWAAGLPLAIVTNCSNDLAAKAVACTGAAFDVVVTAERAGFYKPDPRPYRLALDELGVAASHALFVAGSAYDLVGTHKLGLASFWHDRIGMAPPPGTPPPSARHASLAPLVDFVVGDPV